jgi:hypothetical protein
MLLWDYGFLIKLREGTLRTQTQATGFAFSHDCTSERPAINDVTLPFI